MVLCLSSGGPLLYSDVKFVYNSQQLNGTQRVLLDNVISEEQCRELHRVASVSGQWLWAECDTGCVTSLCTASGFMPC